MVCTKCKEEINSNPIKQGDDYYCSLECANQAAGYNSEEENSYFEENDLDENLYEEFDD